MSANLVRISKFLSLVLRHKPQTIGLVLDPNGWAGVADLIARVNRAGIALTPELLRQVVATNDKQRFAFSEDGLKIRASQGHSIPVELDLQPGQPPEWLFHGTARRNLASIRAQGLLRGQRNHVHLSADERTARSVGQRYGEPVVLPVRAGAMAAAGYPFFLSANGVWLTEQVPVEFIEFGE
jgi:putative RNA 2'-phosphotransferase